MERPFFWHLARWPERGYRVALVGALASRNSRRWLLPLVLSITISATALTGIGISSARPALAASASDRGPSAAVDEFNNQYVFWKGTDSNLWEAYYNSYTSKWNGPLKLGMGPLGSEPSVTVSNQVFAGPGGNEFNAQYVYWQGADGYLWMAYWNGSWHGPIALDDGPICSQPTATFAVPLDGPVIYIFWQGDSGGFGSCGSGGATSSLWFTYSTSFPPYSAQDYAIDPLEGDVQNSGSLGSSPSATTVQATCLPNLTCGEYIAVAWLGTDSHLWEMVFDILNGPDGITTIGPMEDAKALTLGSPPSIAAPPLSSGLTDEWDAYWRGSDSNHRLWLVTPQFINNVNFSPQQLSNSGSLGSAPTVAETLVGTAVNTYVFWKGTDANLWEAYYNGSNGKWSIIGLGRGLLG